MQFYLAPMEEITGYVFRNVYQKMFGDIDRYFTPFITPMQKRVLRTKDRNEVLPENNAGMHLVPQILTNDAGQFLDLAKRLGVMGYREFNLNLGCPSGTVVPKGKGAGFLDSPLRLRHFFEEVFAAEEFSGSQLKLSVKTRLGLTDADEFPDILKIYNQFPLSEVIIHARVRSDYYANHPDLGAFALASENSVNPVCYNGDLFTAEDYLEFTRRFPAVDRVMMGRGIVKNPGLVREITTGQKITREELCRYEHELWKGYCEAYHDENNAMYKMKEVWFYLKDMYCEPEKVLRKIRKAKKPAEFRVAADMILERQELYGR